MQSCCAAPTTICNFDDDDDDDGGGDGEALVASERRPSTGRVGNQSEELLFRVWGLGFRV